jgi:hypothetical protein
MDLRVSTESLFCGVKFYQSVVSLEFRRIFTHPNPTSIAAIQTVGPKTFNKFIIHFDTTLVSYSLDVLAQVALGEAQPNSLQATMQKLAGQDGHVVFFKHVHIGDRVLS